MVKRRRSKSLEEIEGFVVCMCVLVQVRVVFEACVILAGVGLQIIVSLL